YAMVKAFAIERTSAMGAIGILVNQAESRGEGQDTFERLAGVAARFLHMPLTDYGYILRDEHVQAAIRARSPVLLKYPRCSASSCLLAAAARISAELGDPQHNQSL